MFFDTDGQQLSNFSTLIRIYIISHGKIVNIYINLWTSLGERLMITNNDGVTVKNKLLSFKKYDNLILYINNININKLCDHVPYMMQQHDQWSSFLNENHKTVSNTEYYKTIIMNDVSC